MKISVLAFDLSDNATGRADLLARLLAPRYEVDVVGPEFGAGVWAPVRDGAVKYRGVSAGRYPGFAWRVRDVLDLVDGDVLVASKPRPTSFGLALLARRHRRRPLVLDIDGDQIKKAKAVVGSVSALPTQSDRCDGLLIGAKTQVEKQLGDAAEALAKAADPVDDLEGSADYKRHLIEVFLKRAFVKALA